MSEDIHSDELLKQIQKLLNQVNLKLTTQLLKNVCKMWYVSDTITVSAMLVLLILLIHKPCSNPLAQLKVAIYTHNSKQTHKM